MSGGNRPTISHDAVMADINAQADDLLAELGIFDSSSSSSAPPPPPLATGNGPAPPPPPPPPPPAVKATSTTTGPSAKPAKTNRPAKTMQEELDEVFDSVISFANKASNRKKTPPPVAPKPKRKTHVSSYTVDIKGNKATVSQPKTAPSTQPGTSFSPSSVPTPPKGSPVKMATVEPTAFGPGLESFEVNTPGTFEVSCAPETREKDVEIKAVGPTGSKNVFIEPLGTGQFSCEYTPTVAGEHKVTIKVKGKEIKGSPFTANVKYASYTDKAEAFGPGLEFGTTDQPCRFTVRLKEEAGFTRMRVHILGASRAEPIEMAEIEDNAIEVTYHPTAPGEYTIRVLWGEAHVKGSPFNVNVTGPINNDPSKVKVTGNGLSGGQVGEPIKLFVSADVGSGPGPLGVKLIGPSKPSIVADDSSEEGVEVTINCLDPGEYQMMVKWGDEEIPGSPFVIPVGGKGRDIKPELCTAIGDGLTHGKVNEFAKFIVHIPNEAGPGSLGVSISGPHPPKPIEIINNQDGTMDVNYKPLAPGEYTINCTFADLHIKESPFTVTVEGEAVRNPLLVTASGEALTKPVLCGQLVVIAIAAGEGAGAGPLRAKMEGPSKADLHLQSTPEQTFEASLCPKEPGEYKLYFMWGDGDDEESQIAGSPFTIKVE